MSHSRAAFFVNPLSHTVAKRGSILDQSGTDRDVHRVTIDDFKTLGEDVEQAINIGMDAVFIEGGDGTIQGVLSEVLKRETLFKKLPNIVLLPGGMTNMIVENIGVKKPSATKINALLAHPEGATVNTLPLLSVNPEKAEDAHFGFLLSSGAVPAATKYCLDQIHTKGIGGAQAVRTTLFRVLVGRGEEREKILSPTPLKLEMNGSVLEDNHLTSVATTLPKLMIGINPFWGVEDGPVRLTYVGPPIKHKTINIARMFKKSQSDKAKRAMKRDGFESWNLEQAVLTHSGPLILDGEILPQTDGPIKLSASTPLNFLR